VDIPLDHERPRPGTRHAGGGASRNPTNRFKRTHTQRDPDDADQWNPDEQSAPPTTFTDDRTRSEITHNDSPDIPFKASRNPYRGCEHGCSSYYHNCRSSAFGFRRCSATGSITLIRAPGGFL